MCKACSACNFCVFLSCGESSCANRPWSLQGWELRQEDIWKDKINQPFPNYCQNLCLILIKLVWREEEMAYLYLILRFCSNRTSTLTWLDVAIITDNSSPAGVYGEVAGLSFSLTLPLQQFLFLPHFLPVSQQKHSVLQHKIPGNQIKTACRTLTRFRHVEFDMFQICFKRNLGNMQYQPSVSLIMKIFFFC